MLGVITLDSAMWTYGFRAELSEERLFIMVCVLNKDGVPLMPTERHGKVRHLLKDGKAKVVSARPFTIQLLYDATEYVQPVTLGIDAGYGHVGVSALTVNKELLSAEVSLLVGQKDRLEERAKYRGNRRSWRRHRAPRFDNRRHKNGQLALSIQQKLDSHIRIIEKVKRILPISHVTIEVANFDIQAIKNPEIEGVEYQEGEQAGFYSLREYILHRDGHKCQNPDCKNKNPQPILEVHHIGFGKHDRSNRPSKPETFMSTVRWRLINEAQAEHTYGYDTKSDAKYINIRTGKPASGKEPGSERRERNLTVPFTSNRAYRGQKLSGGRVSIRKKRSEYQANSRVIWQDTVYVVKGSHNKGPRVILSNGKSVDVSEIRPYRFPKGLVINSEGNSSLSYRLRRVSLPI